MTVHPETLTELNTSSLALIRSLSLAPGTFPSGIAYDPVNNTLFVGTFPGTVVVFNASSLEVVAHVSIGFGATSLTFDGMDDAVFAAGNNSSGSFGIEASRENLTQIDAKTYAVSQIPSPASAKFTPAEVAFDPETGLVVTYGPRGLGPSPPEALAAFNTTNRTAAWVVWNSSQSTFLSGYSSLDIDPVSGQLGIPWGDGIVFLNGSTGALTSAIFSPGPTGETPVNTVQFNPTANTILAGEASGDVEVFNGSTLTSIRSLQLHGIPGAMTMDPTSGQVFVLENMTDQVAVLSANDSGIVRESSVGGAPVALAFDPIDARLFVASSSNVTVLDTRNHTVVGAVPFAWGTSAEVYDAANDTVYVASVMNSTVTVLDAATLKQIATISVDPLPMALAWDNRTNEIFVGTLGNPWSASSSRIDVINATSLTVGARWSSGSVTGLVYDARSDKLYVSVNLAAFTSYGWFGNSSAVFGMPPSGAPEEPLLVLPSGYNAGDLVVDNSTGELYASTWVNATSGSDSDLLEIDPNPLALNEAIPIGPGAYGLAYAGGVGDLFASSEENDTVTLVNSPEPAATNSWRTPAGSDPVALATDANATQVFIANLGSDSISYLQSTPCFPIEFNATGLPPGANWSISLNDSVESTNGSRIQFWAENGTYDFTVGRVPGVLPDPSTGVLTVDGGSVTESVGFSPPHFPIWFNATGLPPGTRWTVTLDGALSTNSTVGSTGSIEFSVENGSHSYSIQGLAGYHQSSLQYSGWVGVFGREVAENLRFQAVNYSLTLVEAGLPVGSNWSATVDGETMWSTGSTTSFNVPNGTYSYSLTGLPGWHTVGNGSMGQVTVLGNSTTVQFQWSAPWYLITFTEVGLPSGTTWSVDLNGTMGTLLGDSVNFFEHNGSFYWGVQAVAGFSVTPTGGTSTIDGNNVSVKLTFVPVSNSTIGQPSAATPTPGITPIEEAVLLIAAGAAAGAAALLIRARRRHS